MLSSQTLYDVVRKWATVVPAIFCPVLLLIDAPFGRFTPKGNSIFTVDGVKAWMVMELVSPVTFLYTYLHSPLFTAGDGPPPQLALSNPANVFVSLFLIHYLNRAIVSPLRTPSRSKSHIIVPLCAIFFNIVNGSLMGAYLSSPPAVAFLSTAYRRPIFWVGVLMWGLGFVGNVVHDEILFNIRRKATAKGKAKESTGVKKEHYAIPHGLLYEYLSYPNYFCEWIEWLGFALASSRLPEFGSSAAFLATATPPFLFFLSEIFLMAPRALKGHRWYQTRFPDYPTERRAVVPFVF